MEIFNSFSTPTKISILVAALLVILLIVLIIVTVKVLKGTDDEYPEDDYDAPRKKKGRGKSADYDEDDDHYADDGYADDGYADDGYADDGYADDGYADDGYADDGYADDGYADDDYADDDGYADDYADDDYADDGYADDDYSDEEAGENENSDKETVENGDTTDELKSKSEPSDSSKYDEDDDDDDSADKADSVDVSEPTIKIDTKKVKKALAGEAEETVAAADSAFDIPEEEHKVKKTSSDSAFDIKPEFDNPYISPVNPVNAVPFNTVNTDGMVKTSNKDAGIENEEELEEYLSHNPVPKKKKRKVKKRDEVFDEKFGPGDFEIEGAKYFWYNSQDIADCKRKEDMYFHCHYFDNPDRAVIPLITEMYDCAFVKTEELQLIAYGIQFKPLSFKEILNSDGALGFDKTQATKEPSEADKKTIYKKWCQYVDSFLEIIVINASEDVKEFIKKKLYEYGERDVDTLIYDHY